jgi:Family of unknown function (DUF6069)
MTTTTTNFRPTPTTSHLTSTAAVTTIGALAANVSIYAVAKTFDINFQFPKPGSTQAIETVNASSVILATLIVFVLGWTMAALAVRQRRGLRSLTKIGGVVALVSAVAPLTLDAGLSVRLPLASMHLVAGVFFVAGIGWLRHHDSETRDGH